MIKNNKQNVTMSEAAFSLIELLAVLIVTSLILIAAIGVYGRMQRTARELKEVIESKELPGEILQRIAEDIDSIVAPLKGDAADTTITIENKRDNLLQTAQLKINRTYYNNDDEKETFELIIWQANYDFERDSLVLYRSHSGFVYEDKVLGREKNEREREFFVPVAAGLTYFKIEAYEGNEFVDKWDADNLPKMVKVGLSFAQPYEAVDGTYALYDEDIVTRTIAIDRTRHIKFNYEPPDFNELETKVLKDMNEPFDVNEVNDVNVSAIFGQGR